MPRTRLALLDLKVECGALQSLVGLRVSNIYDVNSRTYLLKLQATGRKELLLIESGTRLHTTKFVSCGGTSARGGLRRCSSWAATASWT